MTSISWPMMSWYRKEPEHQQPWYWPSSPEIFQLSHQRAWWPYDDDFLKEIQHANCSNRFLTHWGRVTHICVDKLTIIGSDNGLSPGRRQAIIWTNAGILLIGPLGTNFSEILNKIHTFSFKKMRLKMLSGKWRPFCLGLNVLRKRWYNAPE